MPLRFSLTFIYYIYIYIYLRNVLNLFLIFAFVLDIFVIMNHLLVGLCHDIPEILLSLTPIEITQYIHLHSDVFWQTSSVIEFNLNCTDMIKFSFKLIDESS